MTNRTLSLLVSCSLAVATAQAQTLINNNFDSVTTGSYSGGTAVTDGVSAPSTNGADFGATGTLGNASGNRSTSVQSGIGVNGSAGATNIDMAIRSRSTASVANKTTFSTYFLYDGTTTNNNTSIGMGWAMADNRTGNNETGIDGGNSYNKSQYNRIQFGIGQTGTQNVVQLVGFGQLGSNSALTGGIGDTTSATFTANTWYQLSGDILVEDNAGNPSFNFSNIEVRNWGADGVTDGGIVMSLASQENFQVSNFWYSNQNFTPTSEAYAYLSANAGRGVDTIDNFIVTAVPEPSTYAVIAGIAALGLLTVRRRQS